MKLYTYNKYAALADESTDDEDEAWSKMHRISILIHGVSNEKPWETSIMN